MAFGVDVGVEGHRKSKTGQELETERFRPNSLPTTPREEAVIVPLDICLHSNFSKQIRSDMLPRKTALKHTSLEPWTYKGDMAS